MIPYRFTSYDLPTNSLVSRITQARLDVSDVINCSFVTRSQTGQKIGGCTLYISQSYLSVATEIANAITAGIVVVGGTGNTGLELTGGECSASQIANRIPYRPYPAAYPDVIAVSATDANDVWAGGRAYNYGGDFEIDVAAPGIDVLTTNLSQNYQTVSGTSFSTPHVSALAGLIATLNPQLLVSQVKNIIINTAVDVNQSQYPGHDEYIGSGRINAYQALLLTHAYSNKSVSATATTSNNGRRIVKDGSGNYHLVFESGITSSGNVLSEIFYRNSTDGVNWSTPVRLSAGDEQNRFPSIAERSGKLYVVWQRKTGTDIYNILFRYFNGSSWETIRNVTNSIGSNSDPLPVIAVSTPAATFEMMVAYRLNGGLKSQRTTTANGSTWGSPVVITSNSNSKNPSLVYRPNDGSFFKVAWDDGNNVYHQAYNGSGWASATTVSTGTAATSHEFPSYALSGNNDQHIAWQAFEVDVYQKQAIYHNKNLTNVFTVFASENWDHFRPTASGHTGSALSVVCHDGSASQNILSRYFNGSSWQGGLTGTVIASNGIDASLSTTNPAGAIAKAVWRSAGNAPYTLTVGPSGGLGKTNAEDPYVYHRRIVYSLANQNALSLQITAAEIVAAGSRGKIQFPNVADNVSVSTTQLAETMRFSSIMLPSNADSVVLRVRLYSREAGSLRQNLQLPVQVTFALSHATVSSTLATVSLPALPISGEFRQKIRVAFPVQTWRGQTVNLQPLLTNLDQNKSQGALLHVYEFNPANANKNSDQLAETTPANPQRFELRVHPNPFNPSTRIHFSLPAAGMVSLRIYDVNGRLVRQWHDEQRGAGEHAIVWDGNDQNGQQVTSGTYFSELVYETERRVAKMMLIR